MSNQLLDDEKLSETSAAFILGVSVKTIQRWRAMRQGPNYLKIGRRVKYLRADLEHYLARNRVETINLREIP
jgi:predicted DNA-binding transcriptional regulator AlpA